jgi:hypothetical protein
VILTYHGFPIQINNLRLAPALTRPSIFLVMICTTTKNDCTFCSMRF